eukprot:TRINITY_DN11483_c0_g1_i2.p1 TRINITY_DN11483_c0_g1~~TRINITY_DN11483_c0_g1_i2.p1  ORF type:complete len:720 (+),score=124.63 TRINITY_DN11483_c0_g1_i2:73-2160(+)
MASQPAKPSRPDSTWNTRRNCPHLKPPKFPSPVDELVSKPWSEYARCLTPPPEVWPAPQAKVEAGQHETERPRSAVYSGTRGQPHKLGGGPLSAPGCGSRPHSGKKLCLSPVLGLPYPAGGWRRMLRNQAWRLPAGPQPSTPRSLTEPGVSNQQSRQTHNRKAAPAAPSALMLAEDSQQRGEENVDVGLVNFSRSPRDTGSHRQRDQHGQERSGRQPGSSRNVKTSSVTSRFAVSGLPGHYCNEAQKLANKKASARMGAVDRRYFRKKTDQSDKDYFDLSDIKDLQLQEEQLSSSFHQVSKSYSDTKCETDEGLDAQHSLSFLAEELKEVELQYQVVKWSSQRPESPAVDLVLPNGWWESAAGMVDDQFIVIQLAKKVPKKVHVLDINLPGNDCAPRMCWVRYSTEGENGPWKEAWGFQVSNKSESRCRTSYETGINHAKDFKAWLARTYHGGAKEACKSLFEGNESGFVAYPEFSAAITRCRQHMFNSSHTLPTWCHDASKLFSELDSQNCGKVSLEDLEQAPSGPPEAAWWQISFESNWGSTKKLQVISPLRIYTVMKVKLGSFINQTSSIMGGETLVKAFDLTTLGVSAESVQLRRLAKKYGLSILDVEYMHGMFQAATQGETAIEHMEFNRLLLKLHGTDDLSDVPTQRLRFFWQQADMDCSGAIDFENVLPRTCKQHTAQGYFEGTSKLS